MARLTHHFLRPRLLLTAFLSGAVLLAQAAGVDSVATIESEQARLIRAPMAMGTLGPTLFGDKINIYNGALEFAQTDVSLPGNHKLDVSVGRRLVTGGVSNGGLSKSLDKIRYPQH